MRVFLRLDTSAVALLLERCCAAHYAASFDRFAYTPGLSAVFLAVRLGLGFRASCSVLCLTLGPAE